MATLIEVGGLPGYGAGFLQPKQKNKWRVRFLQFGDPASNTTAITMQAKKVDLPDLSFENHQIHRYNSYANVLGKHKFGNLDITFDDDLGSSASKLVQAQIQKQQYTIGAEGPYLAAGQEGSFYKFATIVDILNGNDLVVETWTYEGCMITNYKKEGLDYSSSDVVTLALTIMVDHAFQCFPNAVRNNSALGGAGVPC